MWKLKSAKMELFELKNRRLLLDTNVLNKALTSGTNSALHKQFLELALNNELNICDTVYYEFLRNCNISKYRDRVRKLDDIRPAINTIRDNQDFFYTTWCLYLYALKNDPKKFLSIDLQDIHIASCAIEKRIDAVLTENYRDFPSEVFSKTTLMVTSDLNVYLMEFDRPKAKLLWRELTDNDYKFELNVISFKNT